MAEYDGMARYGRPGRVVFKIFLGQLWIITNGFIKKTQKTPDNEKVMAVSRRKEFLGAQAKK